MTDTIIQTTERIRELLSSGVMTYSVYDISRKLTHLYEAPSDVKHGEPCLLTEFRYVTGNSDIERTKESVVAWDSAWDFDA